MSVAQWYASQYSTWNRTRRIQQSPYLARHDTNTSRTATAMAQAATGHTVVDMSPTLKTQDKSPEALFGPNIGIVAAGPPWTEASEKNVVTDELTPEVVNAWVERSKAAAQPTTTLQALVNLKRPTLRLSPLADTNDEPSDAQHHHHGLEFEYDCDAPKCGIYVHVLLPSTHPDAPAAAGDVGRLLVFESVVPGGFGKILKLEEGAMLELGRFEHVAQDASPGDALPEKPQMNNEPSYSSTRKRFTHSFHFKKRSHNRSVSGPALAVVDVEPSVDEASKLKDAEEEEGVRVSIRLAALDEQGTELAAPNEQVTYLHVVRFGARAEGGEDTRPWVVRVVKREATIGPHTFHLHEIYGLASSSASAPHAPTTPVPTSAHTYPPTGAPSATTPQIDDEPSSECLLCLSSPREVVLLPCRHLVACRECALNMVEFGAGGNIVHAEDSVAGTGADGAAPAADTDTAAPGSPSADGSQATTPETTPTAPPAAPVVPPPATTRRKRKAKGWFCPVCRQPYTSLLRITTEPPPSAESKEDEPASPVAETGGDPLAAGVAANRGILGGAFRPAFLRGMSRGGAPLDLERQA